jgi:hypothetical protein
MFHNIGSRICSDVATCCAKPSQESKYNFMMQSAKVLFVLPVALEEELRWGQARFRVYAGLP